MPLQQFLNEAGYTVFTGGQGDVRIFLVGLVQIALSAVGVIFFVMILYGGYLWFTAAGNSEKVSRAKTMLISATLGFLITLFSLMITNLVARLVTRASGPTDTFELDL